MTCRAFRTIPTGIMSSATITCAKPEGHKGAHRSGWIKNDRINELTQTHAVRVEWQDAKPQSRSPNLPPPPWSQ